MSEVTFNGTQYVPRELQIDPASIITVVERPS